MESETSRENWWGDFEFDLDRTDLWEIGSLNLWLQRTSAEWRLAHSWNGNLEREAWRHERNVESPGEGVTDERFAVRRTGGVVRLRPRTADRSVVARPRTPVRVPSGHEARIFISSPLWVEVAVGVGHTFLRELPTRRLSNTWFGPTTREGDVAYALKTNARTWLEDLAPRPYRFLTPVTIVNRASDTLVIERLSLPVPNLSLFTKDGSLWSESVRLLRTESGDLAELDVRTGAPAEASGATSLGEARERSSSGYLFRAFSSILRLSEGE